MPRPKNDLLIDVEKLVNLRNELDLTQEGLLRLDSVKMSLTTLQRIESGDLASREHTYQLADALGVDFRELLITSESVAGTAQRIQVLVGLGNILGKYTGISDDRKTRITSVVDALGAELQTRPRLQINISGREGSLAVEMVQKFPEERKSEVNTFLPKLEIEKSLPSNNYVRIGSVFEVGDYIEDRRQALIDSSDILLLSDGKRGITNLLSMAQQQRRKIVPLPFGVEAEGELVDASNAFESHLRQQQSDTFLQKWMIVRAISSPPHAVAENVCDLIEGLYDRDIKRNVVVLHAVESAKPQSFEVRDAFLELADRVGFCISYERITERSQTVLQDIVEVLAAAEACVAVVESESSKLLAALGVVAGSRKPMIVAESSEANAGSGLRASDFDLISWENVPDMIREVEAIISEGIREGRVLL